MRKRYERAYPAAPADLTATYRSLYGTVGVRVTDHGGRASTQLTGAVAFGPVPLEVDPHTPVASARTVLAAALQHLAAVVGEGDADPLGLVLPPTPALDRMDPALPTALGRLMICHAIVWRGWRVERAHAAAWRVETSATLLDEQQLISWMQAVPAAERRPLQIRERRRA